MKELKKTVCKRLIRGAKKKTSGPWEGICTGLDSVKCRTAIVYLGEEGEAGLVDVKEQIGKDYTTFIRRYNKEYRRVEEEIAEEKKKAAEEKKKAAEEKKKAAEEKKKEAEKPPKKKTLLSEEEMAKFGALRDEVIAKQSLQTLDEYLYHSDKLSPDEKKLVMGPLTAEEKKILETLYNQLKALSAEAQVKLRTETMARQETKTPLAIAQKGLAEKIPVEEIEERRHPSDPATLPWDIDAEVFVPIGVGIATCRIKIIVDAVEIFALMFMGRALPELMTIVSTTFIEEYIDKDSKKWSYYTSMRTMLFSLQEIPMMYESVVATTEILDDLIGVTGRADMFRKKVMDVIVE